MNHIRRRDFLGGAMGAAAASAVVSANSSLDEDKSERLVVGVVGCGGMGMNHLRLLAARKDVRVAYVCEPDAHRLAAAVKIVESSGQKPPTARKDLREVLDEKSVEAVWIATPDHWHAPATILACEAGKHVYVEKPCSHNIREGRLMLDAARKHNRIVQLGTQSRSTPHVRRAIQLIEDGAIGKVMVAKAWNSQLRGNLGHRKPTDPPSHLDYDLWTGPAPMRPYQSNLLPAVWRFWYDFGVGDIGNDGVHDIDLARWGLGVDTHPSTITAMGSKYFFDDDQQFPDNQYCIFEYPGDGKVGNKRQLIYEQRDWSPYVQEGYENGNAFYGTDGVLILGKIGGFQVYGRRNKPGEKMSGTLDLPAHHQDFIDCIRSGNRPHADIEEGHLTTSLCHLGNIASRIGRLLHFDPQAERFTGDDEANGLLRRSYREGHWAVPQGV